MEKNVLLSIQRINYFQKINSMSILQFQDVQKAYLRFVANVDKTSGYYVNKLQFNAAIKTRNCQKGELRKGSNECYKCPEGKYSLNPREHHCRNCPRNAYCPGGSYILVEEKFWSSSNQTDTIHDCEDYSHFCMGNLKYRVNPCTKGHFGPLCKSCDTTGQHHRNGLRYFREGAIKCDICP